MHRLDLTKKYYMSLKYNGCNFKIIRVEEAFSKKVLLKMLV